MKTLNELIKKWNSVNPITGGYLLASDEHPLSFHIGYNSNQRTFIVLDCGKIDNLSSSKAVEVTNYEYDNGVYALRFLLRYESLDELFIKLCWDLMQASKESDNPINDLILQYKKWQRLLQRVGDGILSSAVQKGLIGELLFLNSRIAVDGAETALNGWVGPEGNDQDFNYSDYWAEIKTTTIAGNTITVSSLQQLDRNDIGYLIVYHLDYTTSLGLKTISLDEAVNVVWEHIPDVNIKRIFELKLARLGYQKKDASKYSKQRYIEGGSEFYEVNEYFPKLVKGNIPTAIIGLKYELSLPSIASFRIQEI